jgi:predicted signal transduction protein with EAL and GGDEF domain
MKPMTAMFLGIDIAVVVVVIAIEVILVVNYRKKYGKGAKITLETEPAETPQS